jgi:hypothetical protein
VLATVLRYAALLLLVGTTSAKADDEVRIQHENDLAACNRKHQAGKFKLRIEFQACLGSANAKVWARTPHWDLFQTSNAQDFALAERFDKGGMSEAEYRAARAKIRSDLITEATRRDAYRALAKPPVPVQCFTTGSITTCY